MEDKNLENIDFESLNQIDMECDITDDDDDSFGNIAPQPSKKVTLQNDFEDESRPLQTKTGIMINFNDDDDMDYRPKKFVSSEVPDIGVNKVISADINKMNGIDIKRNYQSDFDSPDSYNSIDMETDLVDDTAEYNPVLYNDEYSQPRAKQQKVINDELVFKNDIVVEKANSKSSAPTGEVKADYWKKLQAKHTASNKKGAYNTHMHFCGNPKAEMDMFNHEMTPAGKLQFSFGVPASGGVENSGEGFSQGCFESLGDSNLDSLFNLLGFDVVENSDDSYVAIDQLGSTEDIQADSLEDLIYYLMPYIEDCILYPLEIATNESFDTFKEWVNWFKTNGSKYKQFTKDIAYCKTLSGILGE